MFILPNCTALVKRPTTDIYYMLHCSFVISRHQENVQDLKAEIDIQDAAHIDKQTYQEPNGTSIPQVNV